MRNCMTEVEWVPLGRAKHRKGRSWARKGWERTVGVHFGPWSLRSLVISVLGPNCISNSVFGHFSPKDRTDLVTPGQIFRIGTVRYAEGLWRMRRHGPVIAHCTDSEDFPTPVRRKAITVLYICILWSICMLYVCHAWWYSPCTRTVNNYYKNVIHRAHTYGEQACA